MQKIIERIAAVMSHKELKQNEFSKSIGIPVSSLSEILSGKRRANVEVLVGIATQFKDINVEWLLTGEGDMVKNMIKESSPSHQTRSINDLETLFDRVDDLEQKLSEIRKQA